MGQQSFTHGFSKQFLGQDDWSINIILLKNIVFRYYVRTHGEYHKLHVWKLRFVLVQLMSSTFSICSQWIIWMGSACSNCNTFLVAFSFTVACEKEISKVF